MTSHIPPLVSDVFSDVGHQLLYVFKYYNTRYWPSTVLEPCCEYLFLLLLLLPTFPLPSQASSLLLKIINTTSSTTTNFKKMFHLSTVQSILQSSISSLFLNTWTISIVSGYFMLSTLNQYCSSEIQMSYTRTHNK